MTRESCIEHRCKEYMVIIREDYLAITDNDQCTAALLNLFEYWANKHLEVTGNYSLWWKKTAEGFSKGLMGFYAGKHIRPRLKHLESKGFIQVRQPVRSSKALEYRLVIKSVQNALDQLNGVQRIEKPADKSLDPELTAKGQKSLDPEDKSLQSQETKVLVASGQKSFSLYQKDLDQKLDKNLPPTPLSKGDESEREENPKPASTGGTHQPLATHSDKLEAASNGPKNLGDDHHSAARSDAKNNRALYTGFGIEGAGGVVHPESFDGVGYNSSVQSGHSGTTHSKSRDGASVGPALSRNIEAATPKLDSRLGVGTPSARCRQVQRAQAIVACNYQFSGPWETDEEFQEFQRQLYNYAKVEGKYNPSGWVFTVVNGITKGIHSPLWDDFKAGRPLGSADKEGLDYLDETGNPHEYFLEDRIQYYLAKGEPITAATQKATFDLSNPNIAKPLWSGFLRRTDREADQAIAASKLGIANPVLSPCFTLREKATKESVAAKLQAISSSITLPPAPSTNLGKRRSPCTTPAVAAAIGTTNEQLKEAGMRLPKFIEPQNSGSCPTPSVRPNEFTEDQKFQALLAGMRGHIKSGQIGRVRLATQWAELNSLHVHKIYNSAGEVIDLEEVEF